MLCFFLFLLQFLFLKFVIYYHSCIQDKLSDLLTDISVTRKILQKIFYHQSLEMIDYFMTDVIYIFKHNQSKPRLGVGKLIVFLSSHQAFYVNSKNCLHCMHIKYLKMKSPAIRISVIDLFLVVIVT